MRHRLTFLAAIALTFCALPRTASALCDPNVQACGNREIIHVQLASGIATGDYGYAPGRARMTLPDGHLSSVDPAGVVVDQVTLVPLSATSAAIYENGTYVMTVDTNNSASKQAFMDWAANHPAATLGIWQDLKDAWNGPGATLECNIATGWTAFNVVGVFFSAATRDAVGFAAGIVSSYYAYLQQISTCSHG